MDAFVHVLILACSWQEGFYMALQSTANQFDLEVYTKKAKNLKKAITDKTNKWTKQAYTMPWTRALYWLWWDTTGFEICLYSNDFKGETGITMAYRFLENEKIWIYAKATIPEMDKWTMQTSFLEWGTRLRAYAKNKKRWKDHSADHLPYFYRPKHTTTEEVRRRAELHAITHGYAHLRHFIHHVISIYDVTRW